MDIAKLRSQFPAAEQFLYLDAAHQTPLSLPVRAALDAFYDQALNTAGPKKHWLTHVEEVRARLAGFLGAEPREIAFTKNTSEGLNIAAHGLRWEPGDNVLLLEGDHPNLVYAWLGLRAKGLEVRPVPQDGGPGKKWADADTFAPYIDSRTRAVSLSHVMFHSGQRNDVAGIAKLAKQHGAEVVVDAMQSLGVLDLDVRALGVSALAAGCHKGLLVPQGLGLLFTPNDAERLSPTYTALAGMADTNENLAVGTGQVKLRPDAQRFEIGNFNLPAIHALGAALDLFEEVGVRSVEEHVLDLGDRLIQHLDALGIRLAGPVERERRSHIYVLDLRAPGWPEFLASEKVRVSSVRDGIRVSFGLYNNAEDVDRLAGILRRGLTKLSDQAA
ncbi:aminotransferase class V-fold PLP-dependent enzyme [Streptomyces sp. PSKA54]|uniref:Aminotransferase class V-fold PLP-dependent enzyme n=1 Tax=Streptomyces himalayensis subsp. aureolus TaxID=2758039 RepID=A0A7W2HK89_9ACTN|nr:aminotransferase class V-fold PLP-dependent enzyme [Streptomyces himalayensis subsp. aureolus]